VPRLPALIRLRPRLFISAGFALAAFLAMPAAWPLTGRVVAGWDVLALLYLCLVGRMLSRSSVESMRQRAQEEDEGAGIILALTVTASVASLGAIAAELAGIRADDASGQAIRLGLAGLTILCSWFFLHTVFAIHYAHEFYGDAGEERGLTFPQEPEPDYWDFLYFAFTVGAAAQTSDVTIVSRRLRRLVLAHTVLSFLFNTTVLALVINVGAGLLSP